MSDPGRREFDLIAFGSDRRAFERWRDQSLANSLFDVRADRETYFINLKRWWIGDLSMMEFEQSGASFSRSAARAAQDGVDGMWVQTSLTCSVSGTDPSGAFSLEAGATGVCDLSRPVTQDTSSGTGQIMLLPREAFDPSRVDALHGAAARGARHRMLHEHLRWLTAAPQPDHPINEAQVAARTAAVVVACIEPQGRPAPEMALEDLRGATLRRAAAYIDSRVADPRLLVEEVAKSVGVSRATLYRACADVGGVDKLIWERRLQAARAALSDPERKGAIRRIAVESGFTRACHFSARFKERFGFSPKNLRPF